METPRLRDEFHRRPVVLGESARPLDIHLYYWQHTRLYYGRILANCERVSSR